MAKARKLLIVDLTDDSPAAIKVIEKTVEQVKLSALTGSAFAEYGRDLSTVARARAWLTDSRNWFSGQMYIIKWDGIVPKICSNQGQKLIDEPWDNGLPEVVAVGQRNIREGKREKEEDTDPSDVIG